MERVLAVVWMGLNSASYWRSPLKQSPESRQLPGSHDREVNSSLRKKNKHFLYKVADGSTSTIKGLEIYRPPGVITVTHISDDFDQVVRGAAGVADALHGRKQVRRRVTQQHTHLVGLTTDKTESQEQKSSGSLPDEQKCLDC